MRLELNGSGWVELKDIRHISYGEAKKLRNLAASGVEDAAEQAMVSCIDSWELKDSRGEVVTEVSAESLYRLAPAAVAAIGEAVAAELQPAIPLPPRKE